MYTRVLRLKQIKEKDCDLILRNNQHPLFMKRKLTLLVGVAAILTFNLICAQTPGITADDSKIQYTGRIDFSNPLQPKYIYPGVSIKAKFNGTGISATIHDYGAGGSGTTNYYKVFIDEVIVTEQLKMLSGENTYTLASNLSAGDHTVELMKITEGAAGKSSFKGFTVVGGNQALIDLPAKPNKKIEFIGDSWTCGFGNLSQYSTGGASMANGNFVSVNEDNYYAWGPITARALGAEYHVTATSGRGLYRNNTGSTNNTIPKNYDNTLEDDGSVAYDHTTFHPDVVVIHLGTNDMAQEEGGSQFALDDVAFTNTYIAFINKIKAYHPCVNVIICFGNSKSDSWPTWTHQLTRLRNIANNVIAQFPNGNVTSLELPYTAEKWTGNPADDCGYGDAWHPSKCSHEEMSAKLVQKINAMNVQWGETGCGTTINENIEFKKSLNVYPNPAQNNIYIANLPLNSNYKIVNALGETVLENNSSSCSVDKLQEGLYFIVINHGNTTISASFIKN